MTIEQQPNLDEKYEPKWRWRRVQIGLQFVIESGKAKFRLRKGHAYHVVANAFPDDAKFIKVLFDSPAVNYVWLVIESATFDPLKAGDEIPIHPCPVFEDADS